MPLTIASAHLTDEEFLAAFASCTLPPALLRHRDHLRLAWLMLRGHSLAEALTHVRLGLKRFSAHHGEPNRYHETITTAWVRLLATHSEPDFASFIRDNEPRLNAALLHEFWTPDALESEDARLTWIAPDRKPLPPPIRIARASQPHEPRK